MATLFTADLNNPYTKQLAVVPTTTSPPAPSPSTQPPRSVGVTRRSLNLEVLFPPTIPTESIPKNLQDDTFQVEYQDIVAGEDFGSKRVFYFALLPAIESATTFSGENKFRGNADVPNVKRGIFTRTIMRQLNYPIPSSLPRVQAIAIDSKLMELVGAFIGTEEINQSLVGLQSDTLNSIYPTGSKDLATKQRNANTLPVSSYQSALLFDRRVVQQGKPVIVTIKTGEHLIKVQGVINQFEIHSVRRERTYYRITIIYTSYNKVRPLQSALYQSVAGAGATTTPYPQPQPIPRPPGGQQLTRLNIPNIPIQERNFTRDELSRFRDIEKEFETAAPFSIERVNLWIEGAKMFIEAGSYDESRPQEFLSAAIDILKEIGGREDDITVITEYIGKLQKLYQEQGPGRRL